MRKIESKEVNASKEIIERYTAQAKDVKRMRSKLYRDRHELSCKFAECGVRGEEVLTPIKEKIADLDKDLRSLWEEISYHTWEEKL